MIMIDTFITDQVYFLIGWRGSVEVNRARASTDTTHLGKVERRHERDIIPV